MKNVFNTIRQKVNGRYPYIVSIDGETHYLFEASRKTSLRMLIIIQKAFKNENLIFATIDSEFADYIFMKDAACTYIPGKKYPIYFYDGSVFYEIEEVPRNDNYGTIDLVLTDEIARIKTTQTVKLRYEKKTKKIETNLP